MDLFSNINEIFNAAAPVMFQEQPKKPGTLFDPNQSPTAIPSNQDHVNMVNLIYSNGCNNPATITFHEDGGHGWLQVPHGLIKSLGIGKEISSYSYKDKNFAYLEEDDDLSKFFRALGIPAGSELGKCFWSKCPTDYKEDSPIRRKARYC